MTDTVSTLDDHAFESFVPRLRSDVEVKHYANEAIVWSPSSQAPTHLAPIGALVLEFIDGSSSVGEFVADISEVVGIPASVARNQLRKVLSSLEQAGLLVTEIAVPASAEVSNTFSAPLNT